MSDSEPISHLEELAALHSLGLLDADGHKELREASRRDPAIAALVREYAENTALLAYEAPQVEPPPELRKQILRQLPAKRSNAKIISFSQLIPYAIAACLMILGISQTLHIRDLKKELSATRDDAARLQASNALTDMHVATLDAKDPTYATAKILVAWDPDRAQGVVTLQNLPPPPAGHDYQLWVLDPAALAPISGGVVSASRPFAVATVSTATPGFAISLEPTGGSPEPTGPILFAVAPGV